MNKGWIKLHRKILDSPLWKDCNANQKVVMISLLLLANHDSNKWIFEGVEYQVEKGEFITSLKSIAETTGLDISTVRRSINKFEKYGFATSKSTNKNRLIKIENWTLYQVNDELTDNQTDKQPTSNRQATDKQPTTNKNVRMQEDSIYRKNQITQREIEDSIFYAWSSNNKMKPGENIQEYAKRFHESLRA